MTDEAELTRCTPTSAADLVDVNEPPVKSEVTARVTSRAGGEMEPLNGAAVGAVAAYDMCKGVGDTSISYPTRLRRSGRRCGEHMPNAVEAA